jgi:hypothetical protein
VVATPGERTALVFSRLTARGDIVADQALISELEPELESTPVQAASSFNFNNVNIYACLFFQCFESLCLYRYLVLRKKLS